MKPGKITAKSASAVQKTGTAISRRLYSLDTLRGLDMLVIIGLDRTG